jgi:hypothetical protein
MEMFVSIRHVTTLRRFGLDAKENCNGKNMRLTEPENRPCPLENPRMELALIFRPSLCVMARRLRDVCGLPESECSGAPDAAPSSALDL